REGGEGSPCGQDDAPPGARRLGCREPLPPEPSPLFLLRAHDRETTTTRWPGGSFTSPSARAGPRCRGGRRSCTRLAVQSDLFDVPINAAYRLHGQPSRPSRYPSPNPTPAFGSAPARRLLSFPIPKLAVTNFRGFAHRPLPARTPTRTRRWPSRPRRAGTARRSPKLAAFASSLALLGAGSLHADTLVRAPRSEVGGARLIDSLNADMRDLAADCRVRSADHFPLAGLVGEAVAELELH